MLRCAMPKKSQNVWLLATLISCAMTLSVELVLPLNWDNWVYQTMGFDLCYFGRFPITGSWGGNFPGIIYLHALSIELFGKQDLSFRLFQFIVDISSILMLFKLTSRWLEPVIAFFSCVMFSLIYISYAWPVSGQLDGFALFFFC